MAETSSSQFVKNFSNLGTLDEVKAQLDVVFAKLVELLDAKPQNHSLLDSKKRVPKHKAGDVVVDYRDGVPTPSMSDGKDLQPFNISGLQGTVTNAQHGIQDSKVFDADGTVVGQMHSNATGSASGFMSASDFTKLAGIAAGASPSGATPVAVDATAGSAGVAGTFSRGDHVHQVATGTPVTVGTANSAGTSANLARADHVHNHGNQAGGALHAAAIAGGASGFLTGADKTIINDLNALNFTVTGPVGGPWFLNAQTAGGIKQVALT